MFTFAIFNNGREVDNLDAGTYPTEALARDAGLVALDDLCPIGSPNRVTYRVGTRRAWVYATNDGWWYGVLRGTNQYASVGETGSGVVITEGDGAVIGDEVEAVWVLESDAPPAVRKIIDPT